MGGGAAALGPREKSIGAGKAGVVRRGCSGRIVRGNRDGRVTTVCGAASGAGTGTGGGGSGMACGAGGCAAEGVVGGAGFSGNGCGVAFGAGGGGVGFGAGEAGFGAGGATSGAGGTTASGDGAGCGAGGVSAGGTVGAGATVCGAGTTCGTGTGLGGVVGSGAGEVCWFGDTGPGLAIEGGVFPPPSNTIATEAGGTNCGTVRLCCAATIASASRPRCNSTEKATDQPTRRRLVALGRRSAEDAARAVMPVEP